jgi:hypothetical protein
MIGTQRSGSNLLRLMLNQLDDIAAPHPPHILKRMTPLLDHYGDLSLTNNFQLLAEDVCRLIELNPVPWEGVKLDRNEVISRCRENSLVALYGAAYDICKESWNAKSWCCKSLENIEYIEDIERYFDNPRYIYLYRDGRDVALSFKKAVVGEKHMFNIAKNWAKTQSIALSLRDRFDASRFFSISYEELTNNTEYSAKRLCNFLEVKYDDAIFDFHRSDEAFRSAESSSLWSSLTQPVIKNNSQKFLREASRDEIVIFESIAGNILDNLGYDRAYVKQGEEIAFSQTDAELFTAENKRLKQSVLLNSDKEDIKRRDQQTKHLDKIRLRNIRNKLHVPAKT